MLKTIEQFNQDFSRQYINTTKKPQYKYDTHLPQKPGIKKKTEHKDTSLGKEFLLLLTKIAIIILAFSLLFTFVLGIVKYSEPSMAPAVKDGDLVIFYRCVESGYSPGDAIVLNITGQTQIRRIIAMAGDVVDITEDGLIINGYPQYEFGIFEETHRYVEGITFPLTVPENHIFVLGDNRTSSTDSRIYGAVPVKDALGKVMSVIRYRSI